MQQLKEKYKSVMDPIIYLPTRAQAMFTMFQRTQIMMQRAKLKVKNAERNILKAKSQHNKIKTVQSFDYIEQCKQQLKIAKIELKELRETKNETIKQAWREA